MNFVLACTFCITAVDGQEHLLPSNRTFSPNDDIQYELQAAFINAVPGDVIHLTAGTYNFDKPLDIVCDHITLRGDGSENTILSFKGQTSGDSGIFATGDAFIVENLAVEDTVGNGIKVLGARGVTIRGVRVEWTGGPKTENGAYGIYPVECQNVLLEDCSSIGASDAGIYVGQSDLIVVRRCVARQNVAGIEIENSTRADVYENEAIDNAGGLLVFDLPGLKKERGGQVRVFNNQIHANNHENFASKGSIVSSVPPGTGVMLMATDNVEIFDNDITDNDTCGVLLVSYLITERIFDKDRYDPFPESCSVHDNRIVDCGANPAGLIREQFASLVGLPFPAIVFDGFVNPASAEGPRIRIADNAGASFVNLNLANFSPESVSKGTFTVDRSTSSFQAPSPQISPVELQPHVAAVPSGNPAVAVYRSAPQSLQDWKLYEVREGKWEVTSDWTAYDLNTSLFSDYTTKYRYVRMPEGQAAQWQDVDVLDFPEGTVIAKTFAYPDHVVDATVGERYLETRIEFREPSGWYGYSYIWNPEQTDAAIQLGGGVIKTSWTSQDGTTRDLDYEVPNANQCITCHSNNGTFVPLGPTVRNLNTGSNKRSLLANWLRAGKLVGSPRQARWPKLADSSDPAAGSINERARAWLEVNCAHCHNPTGTARTSGLDLRSFQEDRSQFGVFKSPVAAGKGSGDRRYDIVPGEPDASILFYRIETDEPGIRMPNLARSMVHAEGVELVRRWIEEMESQ